MKKEMTQLIRILLICCVIISNISVRAKENPDDKKTLVIGAGAAGIAASVRLREMGFSVKILEAEDRIGGRIKSVIFGDSYVDLGAEWCHGVQDNTVYKLVERDNILQEEQSNTGFYISNSNGSRLYSDMASLIFSNKVDIQSENNLTNCSLGQFILNTFTKKLRNDYPEDSDQYKTGVIILNAFEREILASTSAFSWFDHALETDYVPTAGNDHHWNGKGYITALGALTRALGPNCKLEDQVLFKKEVTNIAQNDNDTLTVRCSDGSLYLADHVIFTPSLGVLKHNHKSLFTPSLNEDKVKAIESLGFGAVIKVMMLFETSWWPQDMNEILMMWSLEDLVTLPGQFLGGPVKNGRSWLTNLQGFYTLNYNPRVISVWFTGEFVPEIEMMDEKLLIEGVMFAFNKFFGKTLNVTRPIQIKRPDWFSNPHFRGTYSYVTTVSRNLQHDPSSNKILSEPILGKNGIPKILFAGEATNPTRYSTVHGAIDSGHRETNRLKLFYFN